MVSSGLSAPTTTALALTVTATATAMVSNSNSDSDSSGGSGLYLLLLPFAIKIDSCCIHHDSAPFEFLCESSVGTVFIDCHQAVMN